MSDKPFQPNALTKPYDPRPATGLRLVEALSNSWLWVAVGVAGITALHWFG